jgi:hypothetical protein
MNAKQESERLMNAVLPLAEKMLRQYGEFYPYGGYMKLDGTIVDIGVEDPDTDRPKSKDLLYILRNSFREMAETNQCKAVAMVLSVSVKLPRSNHESDAIQVCVEHADGYSAEVFFPYQIKNKQIVYDETFAQAGKREIFGQSQ